MQKDYLFFNNGKLYYEVDGNGIPIIFIHDNTLDSRMWEEQFRYFYSKYKVIRYDLRGFGKSSAPISSYSRSEDLKQLLKSLNVNKTIVVGLSLGGEIAIDFTIENPDLVLGLVLVNSGINGATFSNDFNTSNEAIKNMAKTNAIAMAKEKWKMHPMFKNAIQNSSVNLRLREMINDYSGLYWLNDNPIRSLSTSAINRLWEIKNKTLIIIGSEEIYDFKQIANQLNSQISNSEKITIYGAGHLPNMENPKDFNNALESFIRSLL